jgi:hypothetical protein
VRSGSTLIILALFSSFSLAQTAAVVQKTPTPAKSGKPAATKAGSASPNEKQAATPDPTVMTISGVCPSGATPENCKRVITKSEFDKVISVINPNLPVSSRRQLATLYTQLLALANEAQKSGIEKDPTFEERMRLEKLRILAQATEKSLQDSSKPSEQDVETFYTENSNRFEELALRRVVVPKMIGNEAKPQETKALADKIRERLVAGEDADKLEIEVFLAVKAPGAPPSTSLGWKRRGAMDPRHEPQITPLKAGQLTGVLEDAQNYYIYKVDSKRMIPLQTVKEDIERGLQGQNADAKIRHLMNAVKVDLDEAYFGPAPQVAAPQESAPAPPNKD